MSETISQIDEFKQYSFIDLTKKKYVNIIEIINENYINSKNNYFYTLFYFSATWLPDSSIQLADKLGTFYQSQKKNFENLELLFFSSDSSLSEYNNFMQKNNFIRYTLDFLDQSSKNQLLKYFGIQSLPFVGIVRFELDTELSLVGMYSEKKDVKNYFLFDEPGFPWFIDQKCSNENAQTRLLDEILANMTPIKLRSTPKENFESIKSNYMFLFILFMSNEVVARKQIIKSFIKFHKNIQKDNKLLFLYIDLDKYECKDLCNTSWYTIRKTYFKLKIMRHYKVELLPKLLVLDLKNGDLLNLKIMSKMTEYLYEMFMKELRNKNISDSSLSSRKFVSEDILSNLKKNICDFCIKENKENKERVLYLLYFCSYNTAIPTMNTFDEITKFLHEMPQLKKYLINIVIISSDPTKESYFKLIEELKSNKNLMFNLSALNFESYKIKQVLLNDLEIVSIPWFLIIDSVKGLVLCENVQFFFQQINSKDSDC